MDKITIPDVIDLFKKYYETHPGWGSLHIVLEDGNIKNSDVEFCIQWAKDNNDAEGEKLATILLSMSKTQRLKIGAMSWTY